MIHTPLHWAFKTTPGAPKKLQLFCGSTNENKEKCQSGKKNTKTSDQTHSDKPAFSLPAVPLQDKSFYSATSKGSVLAEPHTSSLSLAWLSFGWFPAAL